MLRFLHFDDIEHANYHVKAITLCIKCPFANGSQDLQYRYSNDIPSLQWVYVMKQPKCYETNPNA